MVADEPSMVASVIYIDPSMLFPGDESARSFAEIGCGRKRPGCAAMDSCKPKP